MMPTDISITPDDKISICRAAAKLLIKKEMNLGYSLDELINEGYIHITASFNHPGKAYRQARMYMLQLVNRSGIGKRVEATRKTKNPQNGEMQVFVNVDKRYPKVGILRDTRLDGITLDELIDVRDALDSLTAEEWKLIQERYVDDYTFEQMAPLHNKKHSTSIKFQIDKILLKLKGFLSR